MGKLEGLVHAFPHVWNGRVLDVGCRSRNLGRVLSSFCESKISYCGVDLHTPSDVIANLERGLPFDDEAFDVVVALDVLEHTDDIYKAFGEICRVARKFIVIMLPNVYEVTARIRFLFGRQLSGKYGLPTEPPKDRHRWLLSFEEARAFTNIKGQGRGFDVVGEGCFIGPRRAFAGVWLMVRLFPNLLSPWYVALLNRKDIH